MDSWLVVWERELLVGRRETVRVGGQLSEEVKVNSVVLQGNILDNLLFLVYVNDIGRNIDPGMRLLDYE